MAKLVKNNNIFIPAIVALALVVTFLLGLASFLKKQSESQTPESLDIQEQLELQRQSVENNNREFQDSTLKDHQDLQSLLEDKLSYSSTKLLLDNGETVWIIDTLRKGFEQNELKARNHYLVTSQFWKDLHGDIPIECSVNEGFELPQTNNILIQWNCGSTVPLLSLINLNSADKMQLNDANRIIPEGNTGVITESGDSLGTLKEIHDSTFEVNYLTGSGFFDSKTGKLQSLDI